MDRAQARRTARAELADVAARYAEAADDTAARAGCDTAGLRDAQRMATAYRDLAGWLDPDTYPRRRGNGAELSVPAGMLALFELPDQRVAATEGR